MIFGLFGFTLYLTHFLTDSEDDLYIATLKTSLIGIINGAGIAIFNELYKWICVVVNDWENHRY